MRKTKLKQTQELQVLTDKWLAELAKKLKRRVNNRVVFVPTTPKVSNPLSWKPATGKKAKKMNRRPLDGTAISPKKERNKV